MTEYAQQRRQQRTTEEPQEGSEPASDLRNQELDDVVACCLAEIDELLEAEQAERDQAQREFDAFNSYTPKRVLNLWQAKYAHLGLRYGICCGRPYLIKGKGVD